MVVPCEQRVDARVTSTVAPEVPEASDCMPRIREGGGNLSNNFLRKCRVQLRKAGARSVP